MKKIESRNIIGGTFAVLILAVVLTPLSCAATADQEANPVKGVRIGQMYRHSGNMYRFHDDEKQVTCWAFRETMQCIPDRDFGP